MFRNVSNRVETFRNVSKRFATFAAGKSSMRRHYVRTYVILMHSFVLVLFTCAWCTSHVCHIFDFSITNMFRKCLITNMDPWIHGSMDPWMHGSMDAGIQGSRDPLIRGSMDPLIHGSMIHDPWIHDPWIHGSMIHESMDPWICGSMIRASADPWSMLNIVAFVSSAMPDALTQAVVLLGVFDVFMFYVKVCFKECC